MNPSLGQTPLQSIPQSPVNASSQPGQEAKHDAAPSRPMLDRKRMIALLGEVGAQIAQSDAIVEVAIFDSNALVLQFDFRENTEDVDYIPVRGDNGLLKQAAQVIADRHHLPVGWLNDAVSLNPLSPKGKTLHLGDFPQENPGLRVFVAQAQYILAMKILAMRSSLETKDIEDIWNLWDYLGIEDAEQARAVFEDYYPTKTLPKRHSLLLQDIEDAKREGAPYSDRLGY